MRANLAAVTTLRALEAEDRAATPGEQAALARWSGWGAVPGVFDEGDGRFADARAELRAMLDEEGYRAAFRNTLNAHYTDAAYVQAIWAGLERLGFEGGRGTGAGLRLGDLHRLRPGRGGDDRGGAGPDHGGDSAGRCTRAALSWPRASPTPVPPKVSSTPRWATSPSAGSR